jgi:tRNA(Ser,Leu) C12 N-acetylase TAN1
MKNWNIVATSHRRREKELLDIPSKHGEFRRTEFRDVIIRDVDNTIDFPDEMERLRDENPLFVTLLAKVVPIEKTLTFTLEEFEEKLKEEMKPYAKLIGNKDICPQLKQDVSL